MTIGRISIYKYPKSKQWDIRDNKYPYPNNLRIRILGNKVIRYRKTDAKTQ